MFSSLVHISLVPMSSYDKTRLNFHSAVVDQMGILINSAQLLVQCIRPASSLLCTPPTLGSDDH